MASWLLIDKMLGGKPVKDVPAATTAAAPASAEPNTAFRQLMGKGPLDEIGQQTEHVRERVGNLSMRLDDLKTLAEDFGHIIEPLNDFILQHTHTKSKLLETEALLHRERELLSTARAELSELNAAATRTSGDLAAALSELRFREESLREQEGIIAQLRLRSDDQAAQLDTLGKQLDGEMERVRTLAGDNQTLRGEIDTLENYRSRAEGELAEARGQNNASHTENLRLQQLAETLTQRMAGLKSQIIELEPQIQVGRQEVADLQAKLAAERTARQKVEANREMERSAQDGEISSLNMRIDALSAQGSLTERMLTAAKDQLRDKSEALRTAEKSIKDSASEKIASDRRAELAQEASARLATQMTELQRVNAELKDRSEMLAKALGAKESNLESATRKIINLEGHIDQLNVRSEQERATYESTNRRLIEELQSEKAERSLAQGALDIARNSRTKLLTQYTALKRQQSGSGLRPNEAVDADLSEHLNVPDNVRIFKTPDKIE